MTEIDPRTEEIRLDDNVAPLEQNVDLSTPPAPYGIDVMAASGLELRTRSQWDYVRRRFLRHRLAIIGLVGLVIIFGAGVFASLVAPYSFSEIDLNNILAGPTTVGHHFFGTDNIGRDYFSRVVWGIRTSEEVGLVVAAVSS